MDQLHVRTGHTSYGISPRASLLSFAIIVTCLCAPFERASAQPITNSLTEIRVALAEGSAEISRPGALTWKPLHPGDIISPLDRLRTGPNSKLTLLWADQSVVPFGASTELEILPAESAASNPGLHLLRGIFSFFHRDKPSRIRIMTRGALAGIEGTEFVMEVDEAGATDITTLSVVDGRVRFGNNLAELVLTNGQQAVVRSGGAPTFTPGFVARNLLQWCFYYPAVLDLEDLALSPAEQQALSHSLAAYRAGDLLAALAQYPTNRAAGSSSEAVYHAALLLSVGQVAETERELTLLPNGTDERTHRLTAALRTLISAVKMERHTPVQSPQFTTELLAASYYYQSEAMREASLETALVFAKRAVSNSPASGFARERVAELEFSFGRTRRALESLNGALELSPRNAQALALKGFLLAAQSRPKQAIAWFDQALAVDGSLGNAWLGRGLCRIRMGETQAGREDLLIAAATEPQRALLRSYLGKAYANEWDFKRADKELSLARKLDAEDPTSWLYSALLKQQENKVNQAIGDLEKSRELNANRTVYRSSLLLDEDNALRSANLAGIYRDAGMFEYSLHEALRAVDQDYANYSAHLFLANSYNELKDPNFVNLRYETAIESEYLLANLLSPASAGTLSPALSQQEYSRLLDRDRLGLTSSTEYLSRGAWQENAAQYGVFRGSSYEVDAFYRSDPGQRPNNAVEQQQYSIQLKQQAGPDDLLFAQVIVLDMHSGDVTELYDQRNANTGVSIKERQDPQLVLGYHHEWSPGVHTLILGCRLSDVVNVVNSNQNSIVFGSENGVIEGVAPVSFLQQYRGSLEIYSGELQQIFETDRQQCVLGTRMQYGHFETSNFETHPSSRSGLFDDPPADQDITSLFRRLSFYGYGTVKPFDALRLTGGLVYDRLTFPENHWYGPISANERTTDKLSPKAGLVWDIQDSLVLRGAYTRSLGGASLDQSFRIEPSSVGGFNQAYRSLIPESVANSSAAAQFETAGLSLEKRFPTRTYVTVSGQLLRSKVSRAVGAFDSDIDISDFAFPASLTESLKYEEKSLTCSVDQLLGKQIAVGLYYRLADVRLNDDFNQIDSSVFLNDNFTPHKDRRATLHTLETHAIWNHPSGFFAEIQGLWYLQDNRGYSPDLAGDNFWQLNLTGGYRFFQRRCQALVGVLNATDQDYRLNPLSAYNELPRQRTFVARFDFAF